jgi:autotransporter-associated beta strand protein
MLPMTFIKKYLGFVLSLISSVTALAEHRPMLVDQPNINQYGNDFWSVHGMFEPAAGITIADNGPQLISNVATYAEWASMKLAWTAHASSWTNNYPQNGNRGIYMNILAGYPNSYVNTAGYSGTPTTARGYVWQFWSTNASGEQWFNLHYHYDQQPKYVCAAYNYYQWTKDIVWLQGMMPKLEAAMDYIAVTMGGTNDVPTCPGANTGLSNTGDPSNYNDASRMGGKVADVGSAYYTALLNMIELEGVLSNASRVSTYQAMAAAYPAKFDTALWNTNTSRYAGWRDTGGSLHDYGFTYMNLEALARGLGNDAKAYQIFDWLDNGSAQALWSSVHVGSTNIYNLVFVPRMNTLRISDADWNPWSILETWRAQTWTGSPDTRYGNNQNDGGGWLWANYYDCMARLKWQDADRAYQKYAAMLYRFNGDTVKFMTDFSGPVNNSYGESVSALLSWDGENGIAGLTPLHGFMGVSPKNSGLGVTPNLPTKIYSLQWNDINYQGINYQINVTDSQVLVSLETNSAYAAYWVLNTAGDSIQQNFSAANVFNKIGLKVGLFSQSGPISFDATLANSNGDKLATQRITVNNLDEGGWVYFTFNSQAAGNYSMKIGNLFGTSLAWYANANTANFGPAYKNGAQVAGNYNMRVMYEYQQPLITQLSAPTCDPCPAGGYLQQGFYPTNKFSQIQVKVGTWGGTNSGCRLTLQRSVAGGQNWLAVVQQTCNNVPDNGWLTLNFADQPPGSYALTLDSPANTIGWYRDGSATTALLGNANSSGIPVAGARTVVVYRRQYNVAITPTMTPGGGNNMVNAGGTFVWAGQPLPGSNILANPGFEATAGSYVWLTNAPGWSYVGGQTIGNAWVGAYSPVHAGVNNLLVYGGGVGVATVISQTNGCTAGSTYTANGWFYNPSQLNMWQGTGLDTAGIRVSFLDANNHTLALYSSTAFTRAAFSPDSFYDLRVNNICQTTAPYAVIGTTNLLVAPTGAVRVVYALYYYNDSNGNAGECLIDDVALNLVSRPTNNLPSWIGGVTDQSFTTGANWVGGVAPAANFEDVLFGSDVVYGIMNYDPILIVGNITLDSTLTQNISINGTGYLLQEGGGIDMSSAGADLTINAPYYWLWADTIWNVGAGRTLLIANSGMWDGAYRATYPAKITKTGAGTAIMNGAGAYDGTTTISGGVLQIGNNGTTGSLGSANVVNNASLVFRRSYPGGPVANVISGTGSVTFDFNQVDAFRISGANTYSGGTYIGGGNLLWLVGPGGSLGTGPVTITNAPCHLRIETGSPMTLPNDFVLHSMGWGTQGAINHDGAGAVVTLNGGITLAGDSRIGGGGGGVGGMIVNGQVTGPGKLFIYENNYPGLTLTNGANNWAGGTEIEKGRLNLAVGGTMGSGAVTVKSGAALGGKGVISGPVTVNSGGTLALGNFDIGRLTINNALTLAAGSLTAMEISKAAGTNDSVAGLTSVSYNGTLTVTNLGGILVGGESYQLFSATGHTGNFSATNLPVLDPGLKWVWTPAGGTLSVAASYATTSTNISYSVSGSSLTLTWPESHLGWYAQSNAVNLADTNYWFNIAGSETATNLVITVNPAAPKVFYRLRLP